MTKLDAINRMLRSIQALELSTLEDENLTYEQQVAIDIFDQTNTFIQGLGWWFNTFILKLSPDVNHNIVIPENFIFVEPTDPTKDYVVLNNKLYDKNKNTYQFTDDVELEVITLQPFEDLPYQMQEYITLKATLDFQSTIMGGVTDNALMVRLQEAYAAVLRQQNKAADHNVLRNPQIAYALRRW